MDPSQRWTAPDFADLAALARAIGERCPAAAPIAPLHVLGEGFFSLAVSTASGIVFRLGTAPQVFERYAREWRVLPWLARAGLPLAVPEPRFLLEPDEAFPFGAVGYPLIAGRTLTAADAAGPQRAHLVQQLAAFIFALHRLPLERARALGVPDGRSVLRAWYEGDRLLTTRALEPLLIAAERGLVERFWHSFTAAFEAQAYAPVMTHGDVGDENLILDPVRVQLVGAIDWEHCALSNPLDDFCNLQYLDHDFVLETLEAYRCLGGALPSEAEAWLEWDWRRSAFPAIRRAVQRGEPLDADAIRASLRRHRVLD